MEEKIMQEKAGAEEIQDNQENITDNPTLDTEKNQPETDALQNQVDELKDKYLRLVADFDNFRKRTAKERLELIQTASKDVISNLLTVLDDTERAEKQVQGAHDLDAVKEGISLVFGKLRTTLQSKGLKAMESVGHEFNPEFHEAITEIPAPSEEMKGKVVDEVQRGYYLNDKIIRHAKVVVGK
jgi:molecular chaperone GrpE